MQFEVKTKVYGMKHFTSKPEKGSKDFYLVSCLMERSVQDENAQGYESIDVFTDEAHYNALLNTFKPLSELTVVAEVIGNKVRYSL